MTGIEEVAAVVAAGAAVAGVVGSIGSFIFADAGAVNFTGNPNVAHTLFLESDRWKQFAGQMGKRLHVGAPEGHELNYTFTKHSGWGKAATWKYTDVAVTKGGWGDGVIRVRVPLTVYYETVWVQTYNKKTKAWENKTPHIRNFKIRSRGGARGVDSKVNQFNEPGALIFEAENQFEGLNPYIKVNWNLDLSGRPWATGLQRTGHIRFRLRPDGAIEPYDPSNYTTSYLKRM